MKEETKVGLFLMGAIAVILVGIVFLGKVRLFKNADDYFVMFTNVQALPPKAVVKIAGVEIGKVKTIKLVNGEARVKIEIDKGISLHEDANAKIGTTGLIGTRFVEIDPGMAEGILKPGSTIRGIDGGSLEDMIAKLSGLFEDDPEHGNTVDNLKATVSNIRRVSDAWNSAMGERSADLNEIVTNLRELTGSARVFTAHLEEITSEKKDEVKLAISKIKDAAVRLDSILAKVDEGKGILGTLVSDEESNQELKESIKGLKDTTASAGQILGRFTEIRTFWNYRYRYDMRDDEGRSDGGVTIYPRPGKFYAFGVTNIGEVKSNEKTTEYERANRITAVLGGDFGPFTGYAGAIRSDGGVGLNFRPFWYVPKLNRRVELNAEAADFKRDRTVNGDRLDSAWVAAGAHFAATRWLWLGVRAEDLLERTAWQAYTNVVFEDKDLAYLLGFVGLAR